MTTELDGLYFPEALRWHEGSLWFSDMFASRVVRWTPGDEAQTVIDRASGCPEMPGGLGWLPAEHDPRGAGALLVVDCLQRRVMALRDGALSVHAELSEHFDYPANDMHVDADGTAWVGSYGFDPDAEPPRPSALVRVAADGTVEATSSRFVFPNGCERDAGGRLVVAETFADRLSVLGEPGDDAIVLCELAPGSGPDGLSVAASGEIFVALAFARGVIAVDPSGRGPQRLAYSPAPIIDGPAAGDLACYDCAVEPGGARIAIAVASADEELAAREPTGRIVMLDLP
ncbi:MAG: SMP-30/gluconolactonase/LRE family protein [Rhodoglobus sp.]